MKLFERVRDRFKKKTRAPTVKPGRVSRSGLAGSLISPFRSRNANVLRELRSTHNAVDAIELLIDETGDVSQSLYNFLRLSNVGHEMEIFKPGSEKRLPDVEAEWREFSARVNAISNAGLDGLIDQFHYLAFVRGAQCCEVEVARSLDDIIDVYPINPQTILWELKEKHGREKWVPFQQQMRHGKVSLEDANFFWVPTDPMVDDPSGRLLLKPVLSAIDFQMQILNDLQRVIHNQGWPRYDISLVTDRLLNYAPPSVKGDEHELQKWIEGQIEWVQRLYGELEPDDSFVHLDSVEVGMEKGGNQTRSLDVRALMETVDMQVMTAAKTPSIMLQRIHSSTESWGTVQFRIFVSGIQSIQRGSKRLIESICSLWLQVKGIQGTPVFTHNSIDHESEERRRRIKQMQAEFLKLGVDMGWIDNDQAANELFGHDARGERHEKSEKEDDGETDDD